MASKGKPKPIPVTGEVPAVPAHDIALHTAARADGLDRGLVAGARVAYAVRGCPVCEELVGEGLSKFPPGGGRESGGPPSSDTHPSGAVAAQPAALVPLTAPADLESSGAALQAVMAAAEEIKPGLAEKLVPFFEMALSEIAAAKSQEQAEVAWRDRVDQDIKLLKAGMEILHNNIAYLYKVETENVLVDLFRIKRALNIPMEK